MLNNSLNHIQFKEKTRKIVLLIGFFILFAGCALISNPEKSGGEILAIPESSRCSFSISGDGNWLQYVGDRSPLIKEEPKNSSDQLETFLIDLKTGENYFAEPDPSVQERISEGLGPDGLGCFSPDNTTLYFNTVDLSSTAQHEQQRGELGDENSSPSGFSIPTRQRQRYYYAVDLTVQPFVIRETDGRTCEEIPDVVKPDIRVERPSEKRIDIYSNDGRRIARHRPRGWFGYTISIWELDHWQWESDYSLSPNRNYLAYRISEMDPIRFSAPTHGYLLNLSYGEKKGPVFLAASIYFMEWDIHENFYACTDHPKHRRAIVRWTP